MGYTRHHAIVVTSLAEPSAKGDKPHVSEVRKTIADICARYGGYCAVTPLTPPTVNNVTSFLVAPDGSNEGWMESDKGDKARSAIIKYLRSLRYEDGSTRYPFVEVQFGDDERKTKICRHSDQGR